MDLTNLAKYLFALAGAYLLAAALTRYVCRRCISLQLYDAPGDRKIHKDPVPRLGGVAVFAAFQIVCLLLVLAYGELSAESTLRPLWWFQFLIPASIIFVVGLFDDLFDLSPLVKLAGQIVASSLLIFGGVTFGNISVFELHPLVDYGVTLFWFLLVINAFNLIDGLDGLAGGLALIASVGLFGIFVISSDVYSSLVMLAFIGALGGFLRYNFYPARIFLGDSGSLFIGFTLAALTLQSPTKTTTVATLGACVLALGVPLLDTALAVWRRSMRRVFGNGAGVMSADMDHIHHRLVKRGLNQRNVALSLYAISATLVALGLLSLLFSSYAHGVYLIAFTFGTYIVVRHLAHVELWDSGSIIARGVSRPSSSLVTTALYPAADVFVMTIALFLSLRLSGDYLSWTVFRQDFLALGPIWVGIPFVCLGIAQTYQRVWSRARVSEYVYLVGAFSLGVLICLSMSQFLSFEAVVPEQVLFTALYFGLAGGLLTGIRALPRVVADLVVLNTDSRGGRELQRRKILVIGADLLYLRYLKNVDWEAENAVPFKVVGLVDDDTNLRKRIVHGHRVLGTTQELPRILSGIEVDEVVITAEPKGLSRAELVKLCRSIDVVLKDWTVREEVLAGEKPTPLSDAVNSPRA